MWTIPAAVAGILRREPQVQPIFGGKCWYQKP
jgi:hypothetical protein